MQLVQDNIDTSDSLVDVLKSVQANCCKKVSEYD